MGRNRAYLPRPLKDFSQVIVGEMPQLWHIPWIEAWRMAQTLELNELPRRGEHVGRFGTALGGVIIGAAGLVEFLMST